MRNKTSSASLILYPILLLAFVLRIWGLDAGLPDVKIHIDENAMVNLTLALVPLKGALWTSGSGFLMPYLLFPFYGFYFLIGHILGKFPTQESFLTEYMVNTGNFTLIGRIVNLGISMLTLVFLYKVARHWFGEKVALISAFFLAVSFIHVKESHYVKNDILVGLLVLLVFHYSCLIAKTGKLKNYILAAFFVGLGFGAKFYPVFSFISVLIAHFLYTKKLNYKAFNKNLLISFFTLFLTISSQILPTLIMGKGALEEFLRIKDIILFDIKPVEKESAFMVYLFSHLKEGLGVLIFCFSLIGGVLALIRYKKAEYLLLLAFPTFFLATVNFWATYNLPRHAIILLPFFIILAASATLEFQTVFKNPTLKVLTVFCLVILLAIPTLIRSIKMDKVFAAADTRSIAKKWVETNIPANEKIVIEGTLKPYIPSGAAPLFLNTSSIEREIKLAEQKKQEALQVKALLETNKKMIAYDILTTPQIDRGYDHISGQEWQLYDTFIYTKQGYKTLILANWSHYFVPMNPDFQKDLKNKYHKIKEFTPNVPFSSSYHDTLLEYNVLDNVDVFQRLIVGPKVEIYKQND